MKSARSGLAALAAACLLAASPAFAATAVCTAKDSAGKRWSETQTGLFDFAVKAIAERAGQGRLPGPQQAPGDLQGGELQGDEVGGDAALILRCSPLASTRRTGARGSTGFARAHLT